MALSLLIYSLSFLFAHLSFSFNFSKWRFYGREFGIPEDKKVQIQNQLIKLSYHEDAVTRRAGVWALGDMEVQRQDAILTVVRRLIDNDMETREEAKTVLKNLTGISIRLVN